jgi:AraC-like DNA-binding protein
MSDLGVALFERIGSFIDTGEADPEDVNDQCLRLLLKLMETEIRNRSSLTRIPVPLNPDNRKITDLIAENFSDKITLTDFTAALYYSERHLSRIFKDDLKITIFEYLKLYRIFQASLLLSGGKSSKTVTEIAMTCGYNSLSSFYKDFKDIFAMTPKAFSEKLTLPS